MTEHSFIIPDDRLLNAADGIRLRRQFKLDELDATAHRYEFQIPSVQIRFAADFFEPFLAPTFEKFCARILEKTDNPEGMFIALMRHFGVQGTSVDVSSNFCHGMNNLIQGVGMDAEQMHFIGQMDGFQITPRLQAVAEQVRSRIERRKNASLESAAPA